MDGVVVHEDHVGGLNGGIGAHGTHGDADVGTGQDGGIVDAVANEGKLASVLLLQKLLYLVDLVTGQEFTVDCIDAQLLGGGLGYGIDVAGEHDGFGDAGMAQSLHGGLGGGL